ncbi:hypothetical protein Tco_1382026, partial [Tanacetum coccineum]
MKARSVETFSTTILYDFHCQDLFLFLGYTFSNYGIHSSWMIQRTIFKFFLDTKELQFSLDDLRRIFQLLQAIDNNNVGFVAALSFSQMLPFFQNDLGFSITMRPPSHLVSKGL